MCFNSNTSLVAFIISVVCSIYLYMNGINTNNKCDLFFSAIVFLIGSMQLVEYFLWENQGCNNMNHIFSLFIMVTLTLQGMILCTIYYYIYPKGRYFSNTSIHLFLFVYACFFVYMMNYLHNFQLCSQPSSKSCRLKWAPYDVLVKNNMPILIIHLAFYIIAGAILSFETLASNVNDLIKYPVRYAIVPFLILLSVFYIFCKEINLAAKLSKNPFFFIEYMDVFGSAVCFSAVLLGIVSVLHI